MKMKAFSIPELLVVVAALALFTLAAAPKFLEAQQSSRISEAKAQLRLTATALEAYVADYGQYPYDGYNRADTASYNVWYLSRSLSTPVAYLTSATVVDPFRASVYVAQPTNFWQWDNIRYVNVDSTWGTVYDSLQTGTPGESMYYTKVLAAYGRYRISSAGPDRTYGPLGYALPTTNYPASGILVPYDPTNGATSRGDILRTQISEDGYAQPAS